MYECNNCNYRFEEPSTRRTTYESYFGVSSEFSSYTPMNLQTCPHCGADDFEELMQCDFCEEWYYRDDLEDVEGIVNENLVWACPKCIEAYRLDEYEEEE